MPTEVTPETRQPQMSPQSQSEALSNPRKRDADTANEVLIENSDLKPTPALTPQNAGGEGLVDIPLRGASPKKKQKMSPGTKEAKERERQAKEKEKEAREKQKAEEKAKREEEKRKREEERRRREELKEEKRREKERERLAKEEEKKRKEKSQMRLNAFFAKPKSPAKTSSQSQINFSGPTAGGATKPQPPATDYEREFPPFFVQSHTKVSPQHRFERSEDALEQAQSRLDSMLSNQTPYSPSSSKPAKVFKSKPIKRRLHMPPGKSVRDILLGLQNQPTEMIDLTGSNPTKPKRVEELFRGISMKSLQFAEDVRPPYQGTFSRPLPEGDAVKLCRNPFSRVIPGFDYGYDSEAEWDDPEEGEDLESDDGDEDLEEEDDDLEGFLDDEEESVNSRRKIIVGDLQPVNSGLRFESPSTTFNPSFDSYRLEVINENIKAPIDPFSSAYWETAPTIGAAQDPTHIQSHIEPANPFVRPSGEAARPDCLHEEHRNVLQQQANANARMKRPFPPEELEDFKKLVQGSNLTKAGLIEVLKKRFPKISKDIIKDTLGVVAVRQGQKEADKKWTLI